MKLRSRLALTTLAVTIPVMLIVLYAQHTSREHAMTEAIEQSVIALMQNGERAQCEAMPEAWSGRIARPPPHYLDRHPTPPGPRHMVDARLFAYNSSFESRAEFAPVVANDLREAARAGHAASEEGARGHDTIIPMPWKDGPCAIILARTYFPGQAPPSLWMRLRPLAPIALLPAVTIFTVMLLALGPVIRRLSLLSHQVRHAAAHHYTDLVEVRGRDEVAELARSFNEAAQEVRTHMSAQEEREKLLRSFLENTTHDVMIPLTVLQGHLSQLRTHLDPEIVAAAAQEVHYMASLIHNLSVAAKLEGGRPYVQKHPVDMNDLVMRCVSRHATLAKTRGVDLNGAVPEVAVIVEGDVTLIEQAVSNVIHNAVRYVDPNGHVAVVLEVHDGTFSLKVIDDGPGIDEAAVPELLKRRTRGGAARTRDPHGHGLGLSIAREVATLHGWQMRLTKSDYGGLQVEFIPEKSV